MKKHEFASWLKVFLFAVAVIATYYIFQHIGDIIGAIGHFLGVLSPFFLGFVIAYILYLPASRLERFYYKSKYALVRNKARGLSVLSVYLIGALIVVGLLSMVIPAIAAGLTDFANHVPYYINQLTAFINEINESGSLPFTIDIPDILKNLSVADVLKNLDLMKYLDGIVGMSSAIMNLFLSIVASIYLLLGRRSLKKNAIRLLALIIGEKPLDTLLKYLGKTNDYFCTFIYCQVIDALILGTVATIGLAVMQVPYAIVLGPILGLMNMIPYFGAIIASVVAIIITIFTGGIGKAIATAIFLIIAQQLDGNIVQPKLLGNSLKLDPIFVILGITVGGAYLGVFGMIIAIPVIALFRTIILDLISYREKKRQRVRTSPEDPAVPGPK
ncbi:MAG TPA: AI-2E family transporter [Firmicutes bacterium]|nr:AI-2E family transporter [Bacillota bacterium]